MPPRAETQFAAAIQRFERGDLPGAEAAFKAMLRQNPKSAACTHFLALIAQQRGQHRKALELFDRAVALDPAEASGHSNRGNLLAEMNRPQDALASYDQALAIRPDLAQAQCNRGNILHGMGRHAQALESYEAALAAQPNLAEAHNNLGNTLAALGRAQDALASYTKAIAHNPHYGEALYNRANTMQSVHRHDDAIRDYDRALALQPDFAEAWCNRGNALQAGRNFAAAIASYNRALAVHADYTDALNNRGNAEKALGQHDAALQSYAAAFAANPKDPEAISNRGHLYLETVRHGEALAEYDRALTVDPTHAAALQGRALIHLGRGDYTAGWDAYEERLRYQASLSNTDASSYRNLLLRPNRVDIMGKNIALIREQGIGDEVMFASILPDLQRDAAHITYACEKRLARLFANSFPGIEFTNPDNFDGTPYDAVIPIGSLGYMYRQQSEDFPARAYFSPAQATVNAWATRLGPRNGRQRVGISWRGGTADTRAEQRSLALAELQQLFNLPDQDFVSLQYGDVADEVAAFNANAGQDIRVFPRAEIDDFEDLAALIANLDLVVSVQNSIVHLCGALGKECLTMVPANAEWRYGIAGDRMAWYDSVRLYRRTPEGGWAEVVAKIAAQLHARRG